MKVGELVHITESGRWTAAYDCVGRIVEHHTEDDGGPYWTVEHYPGAYDQGDDWDDYRPTALAPATARDKADWCLLVLTDGEEP